MDDFVYVLIAAAIILVVFGIFSAIFPPVLPEDVVSIANFTLGSVGFVSDVAVRTDNLGSFPVGETQRESLRTIPKLVAEAGLFGGEIQEFSANVPAWLIEPMMRVRIRFSVLDTNMYGNLVMKWNGKEVFKDRAKEQEHVILIGKEDVKEENRLEVFSEGPGLLFWASTVYDIRNLEVQLEYGPAKLIPFVLSQTELSTFSKGQIEFFAIHPGTSILLIKINGQEIYRKQPLGDDFAEFSFTSVPLTLGTNIISIDSKNGSYNLQAVQLKIFSLNNEVVRTKNFQMTKAQIDQLDRGVVKGQVRYEIKSIFRQGSIRIKINGQDLVTVAPRIGTNQAEFDSSHVLEGENEIEFSGTGHFDVSDVRIGLEK